MKFFDEFWFELICFQNWQFECCLYFFWFRVLEYFHCNGTPSQIR